MNDLRAITITLATESLDDGSLGYTVSLGSLSILADDERSARELAETFLVGIAAHTGAEVRIRSTIETRH